LLRLVRAAIHGLEKVNMLAPTTGALIGAVISGVPGAITGAALVASIAKSFADDWLAARNLRFRSRRRT
jgi:hypothetical protein